MIMGDGNFQWWAAWGRDPERYQGPFASREEAVAQMLAEDGKEVGYTVVEADKAVARSDIIDADYVFERYDECNEECWGEDGLDIVSTRAQQNDLEKMLAETLEAWFAKHGTKPKVWCFGETRNEQYVPPEMADADESSVRGK